MKHLAAAVVVVQAATILACNAERKQECDKFISAMKPLDQGTPSAETVDRVAGDVAALHAQDQPLAIYAENYRRTLGSLSSTLRLSADPSAPDGTDDAIKSRLKEARTDSEDVQRYCAQ